MPGFGDELFFALKDVKGVDTQDLQRMRELGNQFSASAGSVESWMRTDGSLSPNLFQQRGPGGGFTMLPHEAASLFMSAQTQAFTSEWVPVTAWDPTSNNGASWEKGFRVDSTLGRIYVDGITRETVLYIMQSGYYKGTSGTAANGNYGLRYYADDGSGRDLISVPSGAGSSWYDRSMFISHVRSLPTDQTWYELQIKQSSGLPASTFYGGLFTVVRLR